MGKFNLNQILNNASRQAAEGGDNPPRPAESEIKKISVFDLVPSEDNFYSMREIEELKAAIEIAGKVLQNLTVVPLDGGKYKVIAGHRRRLASLALVEDGKPQYEFVTCSVEPNEEAAEDQEIRDGLNLIVTNSPAGENGVGQDRGSALLAGRAGKGKDPPAVRGRPAKDCQNRVRGQ